jgi:pilus assembly protein CpaC
MTIKNILLTGIAASIAAIATPNPAFAAPRLIINPSTADSIVLLSTGRSTKVDLNGSIADVMVGDPTIADVQVRSTRQIWIFAKKPGDTTISATDAAGRVLFQKTIRVAPNVDSIEEIFKLAMPNSEIRITPIANGYLLTGTVASAEEVISAKELAEFYVNSTAKGGGGGGGGLSEVKIISMLRTGTPYQVNLQVRIAEVSRNLAKEISSNLTTRNTTDGFSWGIGRGKQSTLSADPANLPIVNACVRFALPENCGLRLPFNPATNEFISSNASAIFPKKDGGNILNIAGKLFGLDIATAFDVSERAGLSSTLANPNITALSGETGEFLAGGSFPIPVTDNFGSVSVQQQSYGVNLRFTPDVLADGRIRLRLRTEVSDITSQGAVRIAGTEIPALLSRMADTTVELGSGQSFMIGGLLSNQANSSVDKYPGLGDVPILGTLFKSNGWRRNQTELVIVVTPYLVKPVSDSEIKLPTDGFNTPSDLERILMNKDATNISGQPSRPGPTILSDAPQGASIGSMNDGQPAVAQKPVKSETKTAAASADGPGFSFK